MTTEHGMPMPAMASANSAAVCSEQYFSMAPSNTGAPGVLMPTDGMPSGNSSDPYSSPKNSMAFLVVVCPAVNRYTPSPSLHS